MSDNKAMDSLSGVVFAAAAVMQPLPAAAGPVEAKATANATGFENLKATPISSVNNFELKPQAEFPADEKFSGFTAKDGNTTFKVNPFKVQASLKVTF